MDNPDVLLTLSTDIRHEQIVIDDKSYELAAPQDFQLQEYRWLDSKGKRVGELGAELTLEKLPEFTKLLDSIVVKIIRTKMPRRVLRKLSNAQKVEIMNAFTKAAGIKEATPRSTPQDGTSSSPASTDSTGDR